VVTHDPDAPSGSTSSEGPSWSRPSIGRPPGRRRAARLTGARRPIAFFSGFTAARSRGLVSATTPREVPVDVPARPMLSKLLFNVLYLCLGLRQRRFRDEGHRAPGLTRRGRRGSVVRDGLGDAAEERRH
jgi:hypothetical protein